LVCTKRSNQGFAADEHLAAEAQEVAQWRHGFIHHGEVHLEFDDNALEKNLKNLYTTVDRIYKRIAQICGWSYTPTHWHRKIPINRPKR
jgi:hypothetical protein